LELLRDFLNVYYWGLRGVKVQGGRVYLLKSYLLEQRKLYSTGNDVESTELEGKFLNSSEISIQTALGPGG